MIVDDAYAEVSLHSRQFPMEHSHSALKALTKIEFQQQKQRFFFSKYPFFLHVNFTL